MSKQKKDSKNVVDKLKDRELGTKIKFSIKALPSSLLSRKEASLPPSWSCPGLGGALPGECSTSTLVPSSGTVPHVQLSVRARTL